MTGCGIVFITAASRQEADAIAQTLIERKLAACVQFVSEIESRYWWEGNVCNDREILLSAKTTAGHFPELAAAVKAMHSYQVPEIVFVPIQDGFPEYLAWIREVTGGQSP